MPNHCENDLTIRGERVAVEAMLESLRGENGDIDFNLALPYPVEYENLDRRARAIGELPDRIQQAWRKTYGRLTDGYNSGGYEWCVEAWGTKWNAYDVSLEEEYGTEDYLDVVVTFQTAWSPPLPVFELWAEGSSALETFELTYFERGCEFNGIVRYEEGVLTKQDKAAYYGRRGG